MAFGAIAVVGVGLWLGSGQQPVPIPAAPESAVVVSSLACSDGAGGTVVDVLEPAAGSGSLRADLDACGYQEGQQLLVQLVPDDRTQVVLAGNESATDFLNGDRLPVALAIAGLLALGAVVAIWVDGRRSRAGTPVQSRRDALRRGVFDRNVGRHSGVRSGALNDVGTEPRRAAAHQAVDPDELIDPAAVDPARRADRRAPDRGELGPLSVLRVIAFAPAEDSGRTAGAPELAAATPEPTAAAFEWSDADRVEELDRSLTSVDLTFPFSSSLAACLHDELFTHRTRSS